MIKKFKTILQYYEAFFYTGDNLEEAQNFCELIIIHNGKPELNYQLLMDNVWIFRSIFNEFFILRQIEIDKQFIEVPDDIYIRGAIESRGHLLQWAKKYEVFE